MILSTSLLKVLKIEKSSEKRYCLGYCGKIRNCGKLRPILIDRTRKFIWDSSVFEAQKPAISGINGKNVNDLYNFGSHMKFPARSIEIGPNCPRFLILPQQRFSGDFPVNRIRKYSLHHQRGKVLNISESEQ